MLKQAGIGLISASLLLAGCDSGSGSGSSSDLTYDGPTGVVPITVSNADTVTGFASAQASSAAPGSNSTLSGVASSSTGYVKEEPGLSILTQVTKKFTDQILATTVSDAGTLAGVSTTETTACSGGGTQTTTAPSTYNPNDLSTIADGDSISIVFNNCTESDPDTGITAQTSGAASVVYISSSFVDQDTFNYLASFNYNNLKITNTSNGDYSWVDGAITQANISQTGTGTPIVFSLSGSTMVAETKNAGVVQRVLLSDFSFVNTINFSTLEVTFNNNFTVASSVIGGTVNVNTVTPFSIYILDPSPYPSSGQLIMTGAENASVKLTVIDNSTVTLEYDFDGNGIYGDGTDPDMKTTAWSNL